MKAPEKKKPLSITIKARLLYTAGGVTFLLLMLGGITKLYLENTFTQYELISTIDELSAKELKLRKYETEFLLYETSNETFFRTEESPILDSLSGSLSSVESSLFNLKVSSTVETMNLMSKIESIERGFEQYREKFNTLKSLVIEKGFKDYGVIGKMRGKIHSVETIVEKHSNLQCSKNMLLLRRHEKDYLLRKDLKYKQKFDKQINTFLKTLQADNSKINKDIARILLEYQACFHAVIEKDVEIGLSGTEGLMSQISEEIKKIEYGIRYVKAKMLTASRKNIQLAVITLFLVIIAVSLSILFIILYTSKYILTSIKTLKGYILKLGAGELPEAIEYSGTDEIAEMKKSVNILTENLKETKEFAIEVGNGNFTKEIKVFGGKGELGANLITMRTKLMQLVHEHDVLHRQAEMRIWTNEGIASVDEVLRNNTEEFDNLCYAVIRQLVKYVDANQGAVFIKNEDSGTEVEFTLTAAYAFDRRKFINKNIKLGEGIIGACAFEGESCHLTNLPPDYADIVSGLGGSRPSSVLIVPLKTDKGVFGVIELASLSAFEKHHLEFVEKASSNIASHFHFVHMSLKSQKLLAQTAEQAEQMAAQEEELRQNIEEMAVIQENQSRQEEKLKSEITELQKKLSKLRSQLDVAQGQHKQQKHNYDDMYA